MVEGLSLDDFFSKGSFINKGKASGELTWNIGLGRTPRSRKRTVRCTRLFMTAQEEYMQGRRDTAARLLGQTAGRFHRNCKGDDRWTNRTEKNTYKKRKDKRHKEHGVRLHQRIFAFQRRGLHNMLCGNKFDKLSDAQATPRPLRKYMFADVRTYDFGFAVLNRHGRHHIPKRRGFQPLDTPFQMERGSAWRAETKHTLQLLRH